MTFEIFILKLKMIPWAIVDFFAMLLLFIVDPKGAKEMRKEYKDIQNEENREDEHK